MNVRHPNTAATLPSGEKARRQPQPQPRRQVRWESGSLPHPEGPAPVALAKGSMATSTYITPPRRATAAPLAQHSAHEMPPAALDDGDWGHGEGNENVPQRCAPTASLRAATATATSTSQFVPYQPPVRQPVNEQPEPPTQAEEVVARAATDGDELATCAPPQTVCAPGNEVAVTLPEEAAATAPPPSTSYSSVPAGEYDASYSECFCPTCVYYREYYTQQVALQQGGMASDYVAGPQGSSGTVGASATSAYAPLGPALDEYAAYPARGQGGAFGAGPSSAMVAPASDRGRPSGRRAEAVVPLHNTVVGRVVEAAFAHTGGSLLQTALQALDACGTEALLDEVLADLEVVALDVHGCHLVRSMVERLDAMQVERVVSALDETLLLNLCTFSQHTRRIAQSLFERRDVRLGGVVEVLSRNAAYLAATQQGCLALKNAFEASDDAAKAHLVVQLVPMLAHIALDPYGNYMVQCIIEHSGKTVAAQYTVACFSGEMLNLSCNKFASNVMERVVRFCGDVPAVRRMLFDELIFNPAALQQLVQDSFGNFVLQALIDSTNSPVEYRHICNRLRTALRSSPYALKIEAKLRNKRHLNPNVAVTAAPAESAHRGATSGSSGLPNVSVSVKRRNAAGPSPGTALPRGSLSITPSLPSTATAVATAQPVVPTAAAAAVTGPTTPEASAP